MDSGWRQSSGLSMSLRNQKVHEVLRVKATG